MNRKCIHYPFPDGLYFHPIPTPYHGLAKKNSGNTPKSTSGLYADQIMNQSNEQGDKETDELWKRPKVNTLDGKRGSKRKEGTEETECGQSHGGKSLERGEVRMGTASTWKN